MGDEKLEPGASSARWGTWDELLLASAVNYHGSDNWDSVSMEVRSKTSLPRFLTTPYSCQLKYQDLHRRFTNLDVPWLDHLRKLRVAELRRDLHRNDLSILALQTKVKRLEEERDRSVLEEPKPERENPDLVPKRQRSSNDETRSGNGSNSTEEGAGAADPVRAKEEDVQSSASLGRSVGDPIGGGVAVKSEPLVGLLEMIRAHAQGSLFGRRLQHQESQKYRDTVRRHVDLETIQRRLNDGSYASSAVSLHRDLLLLFTNGVVFFPPNSPHYVAAHQLRALILPHIHKQAQPPVHLDPLPPQLKPELERPDPLPARQKASAPLIVCRKRTRPPSTTSAPDPDRAPTPPPAVEPAPNKSEKPVTGVRSSRRNNNSKKGSNSTSSVVGNGIASTPGCPTNTEDEKQKTTATEKKKKESTSGAAADKKRSATDFLKRMKKNSPEKKSGNNNGKESAAGKVSNTKKQEAARPTKKSGGRPVRKAAADQQTAAKEGRQPRKRARK